MRDPELSAEASTALFHAADKIVDEANTRRKLIFTILWPQYPEDN